MPGFRYRTIVHPGWRKLELLPRWVTANDRKLIAKASAVKVSSDTTVVDAQIGSEVFTFVEDDGLLVRRQGRLSIDDCVDPCE